MAEIRHVENRHTSLFSAEGGPIWIKFRKLVQNDMSTADCDGVIEIETRCKIPIWRMFGRIQWHASQSHLYHITGYCHLANSMSWSQSYLSRCKVLPPGEINGCHPRATYHIAGCCHLVNSLSWFRSHMPHCRVQSPGEINVMIVPQCRV